MSDRSATRWRSEVLAGALALGLSACTLFDGVPARVSTRAQPTLWRARASGSGTCYLLGALHLGTPGQPDLGAAVEWAYARADELVLDADPEALDPGEATRLSERYGRIPPPTRLSDRLRPQTATLLRAYLDRRGLAPAAFGQLEPWLVASTLSMLELRRLGYEPDLGLERQLARRARAQKPIVALETFESQLASFSALPIPVQDRMLHDFLEGSGAIAAETGQLIAAWQRGDDREVARIVFRQLAGDPEVRLFYDRVLFARSERMAAHLARLAEDGKTRLVVVGAAQMLGERGIPALLATRGFDVVRVVGSEREAG